MIADSGDEGDWYRNTECQRLTFEAEEHHRLVRAIATAAGVTADELEHLMPRELVARIARLKRAADLAVTFRDLVRAGQDKLATKVAFDDLCIELEGV